MSLVIKFGGTSVGSVQAIQETAVLIRQTQAEWGSLVVVASGAGSKPEKVTDLLLSGAEQAARGDGETYVRHANLMRHIHLQLIDGLLDPEGERQQILATNGRWLDRYEALCKAIFVLGELTPRALDVIGGMGEQMLVPILAAYLRQVGVAAQAVDATDLVVTDDNFVNAAPLMAETEGKIQAQLRPLLADGIIPIVTGFVGATRDGVPTTLGRGGSDYTAAILGQLLPAQEVWIWTDVDGVMSADPRFVPTAKSIPVLSYREVSELAFYGARVLHPKTIRPCIENGIPLRIKNTFNPKYNGTLIVPDQAGTNGGVKAVTAVKKLCLVTVEGKGMLGVPGIAARTFGAVARGGHSVLLISQASSEQSICFAATSQFAAEIVANLENEFADELKRQDIDRIWALEPVSIITAVGAGMRHTPGIAGQLFTALGDASVNVVAIAQGSSECSISVVVTDDDAGTAVRKIHRLIGN